MQLKLTWYGHSAFRIEAGGATILIDPYLAGSPSWGRGWETPAMGVTHVVLTHGHGDHIGDAAAILNQSGAVLLANPELCSFLVSQGLSEAQTSALNFGGSVDLGSFSVSLVPALHSSSIASKDGSPIYLGNPGGAVIHFQSDKCVYHMGDTDIFSDMALIRELHSPQIGLVPIGDRFTMGGAVAALACRRFFDLEVAIPCHYGTFPVLDQSPETFIEAMEGSRTIVAIPKIGEPVAL